MKEGKRATITLKKPKRRTIQPEPETHAAQKVSQVKPPAEPEPPASPQPDKKTKIYKTDTNPNAGQPNNDRDTDVKRLNQHLWTRPVWREFKPLAIGISHAVFEEADKIGVSRTAARVLMRQHTMNDKYIANLADNTESISRYDLKGKPTGFILPEARYSALAAVERRHKAKERQEKKRRGNKPAPQEPDTPQMTLNL